MELKLYQARKTSDEQAQIVLSLQKELEHSLKDLQELSIQVR